MNRHLTKKSVAVKSVSWDTLSFGRFGGEDIKWRILAGESNQERL